MQEQLLFVVSPYLAVAVFAGGLGWRAARPRGDGGAAEKSFRGGLSWRLGLGGLLVGHLLGFALPQRLLDAGRHPGVLRAVESTGLFFATLALLGLGLLVVRSSGGGEHLRLSAADTVFLTLLAAELLSGTLLALDYRWGTSWYAATLVPYLRSLVALAPAPELLSELPFLARLHTFGAFALVATVPFTRVADPVLAPMALLRRRSAAAPAVARSSVDAG